ncbi:MAG: hypothetical protein KME25_25430 [Symplocastrum torsivum CPER-KK1]|jgi:hypothetical protein|uniref:Uncharacterized protein n=1 Tax=Symplocastrum torsivum CPER-KK1 TaxID=450513 RepID=A0A951PR62_9CYAN|nr:hypothetical protein [Symplocastrum torsivum CPER-KK1]
MRIKKFPILLSIVVVLLCCFSPKVDAYYQRTINSITTIISDMTAPHEGMPHGVPTSYNWASKPRVGWGNNPQGFQAMTAWGQLYEAATGNPATNTRVQIKNIRAYMLSNRNGQWYLLQSSTRVEGAAYQEDYAGDVNKVADIRYEPDGSVSVKPGQGYNYHFWPPGRASIDPNDVAGIFTTVQARLVIDNPKQANDRAKARYVLSMGGDYWLNLTANWDNWKTNGDIGIGKFKYVSAKWWAFNMTTLSSAQILQNPPPLE